MARTKPKSKLTPEIQEKIVSAISSGSYQVVAARAAGIAESTFYYWMERGEADVRDGKDTPYARIRQAVKDADAAAEVSHVAQIVKAGSEQWQARAWILERKHPERWARRDRTSVELTGKNGTPLVKTPTTKARQEEVARILRDAETRANK